MLKLTKKADYGLIALRHLSLKGVGRSVSAKELADSYHIPLPILSKVLQRLAREGFVVSEQGTNGGYKLARHASTITALEVIRAMDGPILLTACFTEHGECDQSATCSVREPLRKVHEGILRLLDSITMMEIASEEDPASAAQRRASAFPVQVLPS